MFKGLFKKIDEDDEIFETVDPIVEQRRNEKFSKPLIYDDEFSGEKTKKKTEEKKEVKKANETAKAAKKQEVKIEQPKKSGYEMMDVISPMFGMTNKSEKKVTKPKVKKVKKKNKHENSLIQVISPYYGNFEVSQDIEESEAVLTPAQDENENNTQSHPNDQIPTVEDNLRNIAKIVEEEQNQLKIIEERTGEFKLDFGTSNVEKQNSLIDEIDDNMSLDELMSLYEKKFKD